MKYYSWAEIEAFHTNAYFKLSLTRLDRWFESVRFLSVGQGKVLVIGDGIVGLPSRNHLWDNHLFEKIECKSIQLNIELK